MPTYDYRCELCQQQFELWQSFSDDTLTTCPVDGGPPACQAPGAGPVKKVFSQVGISFKGDGFYKNDHGANASRRKEKSGASGSDSSSKSGASGSDSSSKSGASGSDSSSKSGGSGSDSSSTTRTSSRSDKVSS